MTTTETKLTYWLPLWIASFVVVTDVLPYYPLFMGERVLLTVIRLVSSVALTIMVAFILKKTGGWYI